MARYTGPKARINRRLGTLIYETAGAARALDRRPQPPGMHARGRRPSNYGLALMEKQKIKHYTALVSVNYDVISMLLVANRATPANCCC